MSHHKIQQERIRTLKKQRYAVGHLEQVLDYMRDDAPLPETIGQVKALLETTRNYVKQLEAMLDD